MINTLYPEPLMRETFAQYGDVIETAGSDHFPINAGTTERFHDLATLDVLTEGGWPLVSIFRGQPVRERPVPLNMMERHPLGSQAFMPLSSRPFLVVVADAGEQPLEVTMRAFISTPGQGVNYHRGVWHHPLLAIDAESDFLVIDRGGPGLNCDEFALARPVFVEF